MCWLGGRYRQRARSMPQVLKDANGWTNYLIAAALASYQIRISVYSFECGL